MRRLLEHEGVVLGVLPGGRFFCARPEGDGRERIEIVHDTPAACETQGERAVLMVGRPPARVAVTLPAGEALRVIDALARHGGRPARATRPLAATALFGAGLLAGLAVALLL